LPLRHAESAAAFRLAEPRRSTPGPCLRREPYRDLAVPIFCSHARRSHSGRRALLAVAATSLRWRAPHLAWTARGCLTPQFSPRVCTRLLRCVPLEDMGRPGRRGPSQPFSLYPVNSLFVFRVISWTSSFCPKRLSPRGPISAHYLFWPTNGLPSVTMTSC
jgi:hypothetical protein